jgi:thiamine-monophosphate kinase
VSIVGGNLARTSGPIVVDVTAIGEVEQDQFVQRTGAKVGDRLLVTGALGGSAAGRHALERRVAAHYPTLVDAHLHPHPRVHEGRLVARSGWATSMIDLSDGLATDLWRLCEANGLGVRVNGTMVPINAPTKAAAARIGLDAFELAIYGGEDYELLFSVPPSHADSLAARLQNEVGTPATIIGEFVEPSQGRYFEYSGKRITLEPRGWDHFAHAEGT